MDARGPNIQLSERQHQVLDLIGRGRTNGEIATELEISFATAKWYVSDLISLYGVDSREDLIEEWRAERGLRRRLTRLAALLAALPAKAAVATAATGGAAIVVAAVAIIAFDGGPETPAAAPTVTATATSAGPFSSRTVTAVPNIVRVQPADGVSIARGEVGQPSNSGPEGVCAEVNFVGLQHNFQEFQLFLDGVDVTTKLYLYAASVDATGGSICLGGSAPAAGIHHARIVVADPISGALREPPYEWSFTITQ